MSFCKYIKAATDTSTNSPSFSGKTVYSTTRTFSCEAENPINCSYIQTHKFGTFQNAYQLSNDVKDLERNVCTYVRVNFNG